MRCPHNSVIVLLKFWCFSQAAFKNSLSFLFPMIYCKNSDTWCGRFAQFIVSSNSTVHSGFHCFIFLFFFITDQHGQHLISHKAKINNTATMEKKKKFTFSTYFERVQHFNPAKLWNVQFSCSLYLYILFPWVVVVVMEGLLLMYIFPSIRFELDFYRILCRVLCFGEILPVVRDFCSLSLVSVAYVLFHPPRC